MVAILGRRNGKRIDDLLHRVSELETQVDGATICTDLLESEEFADLAVEAVEAAVRTHDEVKIRQYAAILVGSVNANAPADLEPSSVLRALAELTPKQVALLALVQCNGGIRIHALNGPSIHLPTELVADLNFDLGRIEATGLLESSPMQPLMGGPIGRQWTPTVTMTRLRELLRAGGYEI